MLFLLCQGASLGDRKFGSRETDGQHTGLGCASITGNDAATRPRSTFTGPLVMNISFAATLLFCIGQLSLLGALLRRRRRAIDYDDCELQPLQQDLHQSELYTCYRYTVYRIDSRIYQARGPRQFERQRRRRWRPRPVSNPDTRLRGGLAPVWGVVHPLYQRQGASRTVGAGVVP